MTHLPLAPLIRLGLSSCSVTSKRSSAWCWLMKRSSTTTSRASRSWPHWLTRSARYVVVQQRVPTIPEALFATSARAEGEYVFYLEDGEVGLSSVELAERAHHAAQRLVAMGVQPGDAVGVLGPNRPEWVIWAFAVWSSGAVLVPVQIPLRIRDPDAFKEQLRSLVDVGNCRLVLADPRL